jgi:hypothetical protein
VILTAVATCFEHNHDAPPPRISGVPDVIIRRNSSTRISARHCRAARPGRRTTVLFLPPRTRTADLLRTRPRTLRTLSARRMRHQQSMLLLLAAAAVACSDWTGPTRSVTLSFCSGTVWVGVQNEGEDWVTIADGPGDATINASERLIVARMIGVNDGELALYYLTRDQAQATFACPTAGTKSLSGSVTGVSSGSTRIWLGNSNAGTGTLFTTFTLTNVLDGPLDLVAVNRHTAIIRRRVNYADGTTIPVLDFLSAEAFALEAHSVAIEANGVFAPEWTSGIVTNGGTSATLSSIGGTFRPCCIDDEIYTLPASRQESGDLYRVTAAGGHRTDARLVERFYDTPSNQTVGLRPAREQADGHGRRDRGPAMARRGRRAIGIRIPDRARRGAAAAIPQQFDYGDQSVQGVFRRDANDLGVHRSRPFERRRIS